MFQNERPIGVLDSGVGGLTVVRQLQRLLPGEDIVYYGDSANCPYGNRSEDEIFALAMNMLRHLEERQVKCVAIACNTISTLIDRLRPECPFPLLSIVEAGSDYVVREKLRRVGLFATEFTVKTGAYDKRIHAEAPDCEIISKGSPNLAALVDRGDFDQKAIDEEIYEQIDVILSRAPVEELILACTHFPIVLENFHRCYPQLRFIDPAEQQAAGVRDLLVYRSLTNPQVRGKLAIETSGDPAVYLAISKKLKLFGPDTCQIVPLSE